jgi:hypothetical protein
VRRVKSCNSALSAVLMPRSAMTCRASSMVVIGPGAARNASSVARVMSPHVPRWAAFGIFWRWAREERLSLFK